MGLTHAQTRRSFLQQGAVAAGGLTLAGWLAACGSGDDDASGASGSAIKLSLPTAGGAGSVWRSVIEQDRLLAGGPKVSWVGGDPGQVQTQLLAKTVDFTVFGSVTAAQANAKGNDVLLVGAAINNHGRWLVPANSPYKTPKDLRGKKIATQPSNSDTFVQAAIVAALGGDDLKKDYKLFFGAPAANVALFQRGDVDAIIAIEPSATRLVAAGAREIARVGDLWQQYTNSTQPMLLNGRAVRADQWKARKADFEKVVDGFTKANAAIKADPTLLVKYAKAMGLKPTEKKAIALLPERMKDVYPDTFDADTLKGLDAQIDQAVKLGLLAAPPKTPVYARDVVA
ncbi:MAG TPA: ABC transporter substrate-binding protein [Baekduia sp.]|nr:ABC transporter substrate-binding protein [Baekduia sp.]